jgi:hypothetical protein
VGYAACLGLFSILALHRIRRLRQPVVFFFLGLLSLAVTFWFALWLESGLVQTGQADYQAGLPYRHFIRVSFAVFLIFFLARGGYLLRHFFSRKSPNAA